MKSKKCRITGIIVPSEWTDSGGISNISLLTPDEKEYQVDLNKSGRELMKKINEQVEIEGKLEKLVDGQAKVYISRYRTVNVENDCSY